MFSKNKNQLQCCKTVTVKLICIFAFASAKCCFSHDMPRIIPRGQPQFETHTVVEQQLGIDPDYPAPSGYGRP